jgi:hypothetical protein
MNNKIAGLVIVLALILSAVGCVSTLQQASLGQEFTLKVGQSAEISGENLTLKFVGVTNDSRAPRGVESFWAGEAKSQLRITYKGSTYDMQIIESGGTDGYTRAALEQYSLEFKLEPYPDIAHRPTAGEYRLLLIISR